MSSSAILIWVAKSPGLRCLTSSLGAGSAPAAPNRACSYKKHNHPVGPQPPLKIGDHGALARGLDPTENTVRDGDVDIIRAVPGRFLKACVRDGDVGEGGICDQASRMNDLLGVEVAAFECDLGN